MLPINQDGSIIGRVLDNCRHTSKRAGLKEAYHRQINIEILLNRSSNVDQKHRVTADLEEIRFCVVAIPKAPGVEAPPMLGYQHQQPRLLTSQEVIAQ